MKKRIYEIAKEEGLPSATLLQRLQRAGLDVKTASSTVEVAEALHALNPNRYPKPEVSASPEPAPKKASKPRAKKAEAPPKPTGPTAPVKKRPTRPRGQSAAARAAAAAAPEPVEAPAPVEAAPSAAPPPSAEVAETVSPAAAQPTAEPTEALPTAPREPAPTPVVEEAAPPPAAPIPPSPGPEPEPIPEPVAEPAPEPVAEVPAAPVPEAPAPAPPAPVPAEPEPVQEAPAPAPKAEPAQAPGEQPVAEAQAPPAPEVPEAPEPPPAAEPAAEEEAAPETADQPTTEDAAPAAAADAAGPSRRTGPVRPASPLPAGSRAGGQRGRRRRVVIDPQAGRRPQPVRDRRGGPKAAAKEERDVPAADLGPLPEVEVRSGSTVKDIAEAFDVPTAQIIKLLMGMGELATITQSLSDDAIELLATELEREVRIIRAEDEDEIEISEDDAPEDLRPRAPVVTIMGHVDHGKTSLLDAIRSTEVAAGEAGGITQHIGAYQVRHDAREITFLDTPGHEAFTAMRARGARLTDVAVIVVAADDGVMPQSVEAIDHARAASVPFMVAINKVDKADANPDRVRQELSQHEVVPSTWGGTHEFVEVSAISGQGIEDLLETVLLVADADAEPVANPNAPASGTVIESRLDPGRGPVCTFLVQRGTMHVGDILLVGDTHGRVRAMHDFRGTQLESAGPSVPVEVLGMDGVPDAGEKFRAVENERTARQLAAQRAQRLRAEELANRRPVSLDDLFARIQEGGLKELNLIIKGDVQGSVGALQDALSKIPGDEVRMRVIHTGVGAITESDVMLAAASEAIVLGFNVRPRPEAKILAEREGVDVRTYRVIYRAIEDVRDALIGMLEPETVEDIIGMLEVRATFRASRIGTIAGCYVTDGVVRRSAQIRLIRDGTVVYEGSIGSLRRFDEDVREVASGFECGVVFENFNDVKDGDTAEVFELRQVARTSQNVSAEVAE